MIAKPQSSEYNSFYQTYTSKIEEEDVLDCLKTQYKEISELLKSISLDMAQYRYAEGKWNVAELIQHINDTERVFAYRGFAISRGEKQPLPGMDQDEYAQGAETDWKNFESLIAEFESVRMATITLFENMSEKQLSNIGEASGFPVTARATAAIIAGHAAHHIQILKERYLQS